MIVADVAAQVEFLRAVFDATGDVTADGPAEIRIGNSRILISRAGERDLFPAFLYIHVDDPDSVIKRALAAGAVSVEPPLDTPYGDRRAMVRDTSGNIFQIARRSGAAAPRLTSFEVTPIAGSSRRSRIAPRRHTGGRRRTRGMARLRTGCRRRSARIA